jgi:long-chain acyl-CoA synthetase
MVGLPSGVKTLHDNLLHGVRISGDNNFMGYRPINNGVAGPYQWISYNTALKRVTNVGSALVKRGFPQEGNVGLFSINRPEWVIAEHACFKYNYVTVPLYDTLGEEAIDHIMNVCEIPVVFCTADKAKILYSIAGKLKNLKLIVVMDKSNDDLNKSAASTGINLIEFTKLEDEGAASVAPQNPTHPDSVATICFTSGTTGLPKGVILTHGNLLSFVTSYQHMVENGQIYAIGKDDIHISYLPLAHVFERIVQSVLTYAGSSMGFYQGDTLKLLDDVAELKPTIFCSVPRLYNRIYDKVLGNVKAAGGVAAYLFNLAYKSKMYWLRKGYVKHSLWDKLVFAKVRARLGGRVELMLTGAAPISKDVMDFLRICFSAKVIEGYGQTETTGCAFSTHCTDVSSGHVGPPAPSCISKLRDVPSMNYFSTDKPFPRGEICIKGNNCFKGYYKEPGKTAETLSADGWVYTGDIGYWDDKGRLVIVDRVKNIFKLAQGEYIAPEKVEVVYQKHELVAQSFVYGDSLQSTLVGIVVPEVDPFLAWAKEQGFPGKTAQELVQDKNVRKAFQKVLEAHGRQNDLKGFENVKAVYLDLDPFTPENGLLTPTFKLKVI